MTAARTKKSIAQLKAEAHAPFDSKAEQQQAAEREAARTYLKDVSVEKLLTDLTSLSVSVGGTLAVVGEQIRAAFTSLRQLQVAVGEQEARLQELHDIDAAQTELDSLVAEYESKEAALAARLKEIQRAFDEAVTEREVNRRREEESYDYRVKQQRAQDSDQYAQSKLVRDRVEQDERARRLAEMEERDKALKLREQELADLKTRVESFPAQLKKECDAAVAQATSILKRTLEHEHSLALAKLNGELALVAQAKTTLEAQLKAKDLELARASDEARELRTQVQTIATKALDSAAGARALDEVRSIAKEQAQGLGKGGK